MAWVFLLNGLMVLDMLLVRVGLLLVVVHQGHALLATRRPIKAGVVPDPVVLAVHASCELAQGAAWGWSFVGRRRFGGEVAKQRAKQELTGNRVGGAEG